MINPFRSLSTKPLLSLVVLTPIAVLLLFAALTAAYFATHATDPYAAELAFIEYSSDDNVEGSLVPASCESSDAVNHFPGDCACSIGYSDPCIGAACNRTITWNVGVAGSFNLWMTGAGNLGPKIPNGNQLIAIPPGGATFRARRADMTVLCSQFVPGYPAPTLVFTGTDGVVSGPNITADPFDDIQLNWTVTNAATCNASNGWAGAQAAADGAHSSPWFIPPGDSTYTLTCTGPGGSVSRSVVVDVRSPVVTLNAVPDHIGPGMVSNLNWTVWGATSCSKAETTPTGFMGLTPPVDDNQNVSPLLTTNYTLTCTGPGGVTPATEQVLMPSGILTATDCVVADFDTSCDSTVFWIANNFLGAPSLLQGAIEFSNAVTDTMPIPVNPSSHTVRLEDTGSAFFLERNPLAECLPDSVWAGGRCWPRPDISLPIDSVIRSGSQFEIEAEITANYPTTCTMDDGVPQGFVHAASAGPVVHTLTTRVLRNAQVVTFECHHTLYPTVNRQASMRIEVVPNVQEI